MWKRLMAFFISIATFICGIFGIDYPKQPIQPPENSGFTDALIEYMPDDVNYMLSPLSISVSFGMLSNGAAGDTLTQIIEVLGLGSVDDYNSYVKSLLEQYTKTDFLTLEMSNSIWLNTDYAGSAVFSDAFKATLSEYYSAESDTVNCSDAVERINAWVADKTNDKITSIIEDPQFLCCLLNALYFKGSWELPFNKESTKKAAFTSRNGSISRIDFMNTVGEFPYYSDGAGTQVIELPYASMSNEGVSSGLDIGMYIILSNGQVFPESLLDNITLKPAQVTLSVPKFTTEYEVKLNDMLASMGMTDVFDENRADIGAMFSGRQVDAYISDAIHKTYISVDEKGTEAAAVTALLAKETAIIDMQKVKFKADRPFMYVIRDNTNGEILFVGEFAFAN